MILLDIFVPGTPIAQPRYARNPKSGGVFIKKLKHGRRHPIHAWRELICLMARAYRKNPYPVVDDVPLEMRLDFYFNPPKSWSKKKVESTFDGVRCPPHFQRPDRKNLLAAVEDALNGIIYQDDCQPWCGDVRKYWTQAREGVRIFIQTKEK